MAQPALALYLLILASGIDPGNGAGSERRLAPLSGGKSVCHHTFFVLYSNTSI